MTDMANSWDIADREILRLLFKTDAPMELYVFHEKFNLLPVQILKSVRKLLEIQVIKIEAEGRSIALTEKGKNWTLLNRKNIFMRPIEMYWKAAPISYTRQKMQPFEPYVPKRRFLSKKFFDTLAPKG
jgi:hypothetical protein